MQQQSVSEFHNFKKSFQSSVEKHSDLALTYSFQYISS